MIVTDLRDSFNPYPKNIQKKTEKRTENKAKEQETSKIREEQI